MPIEDLPIFCFYDRQRFIQFGSMDCANWYGVQVPTGKKKQALYPAMGRKHVRFLNENRLVFDAEPRNIYKTINFFYVFVGTRVYQYDRFYNEKFIGTVSALSDIWFDFLAVGTIVYAMLTDGTNIFVITEDGNTVTMQQVTDSNAPDNPQYVKAFGNRFTVNEQDTPNYFLTQINLGGAFNPATVFTVAGSPLFNSASGIVRQFAVLHNQLYIFNDFTADVLSNVPTDITVAGVTFEFPWKVNTSYNFDYGMADPKSLSVDFGRMTWLAKNSNGLVSFMTSDGQAPKDISSQAINVLLEKSNENNGLSPFLTQNSDGFLFQYENTIFYRVVAGKFLDFGNMDLQDSTNALEYNYETDTWHRLIELNGGRNRIQKHIFFNNTHLVTVEGDFAIYEMAGNIYYNELRRAGTDPQAINAFAKFPMRYELVTQQIYLQDYAEFVDKWVEIDFVFGDQTFYKSQAPFLNTVFVVSEESTPEVPVYVVSEDNKFVIAEASNTPTFDDNHYYALFKPHIELYYSDDGGVTFLSADNREFSPLGQYRWRMRWYELGASRNRCYKLVCVSSAPIVILGGIRMTDRVSGGAS